MKFKVGDRVRVNDNIIAPHAGKEGEVYNILYSGHLRIRFENDTQQTFHPDNVTLVTPSDTIPFTWALWETGGYEVEGPNGEKADELFKTKDGAIILYHKINGSETWEEHNLKLRPKTIERWVNVYKKSIGGLIYDTIQEAKDNASYDKPINLLKLTFSADQTKLLNVEIVEP